MTFQIILVDFEIKLFVVLIRFSKECKNKSRKKKIWLFQKKNLMKLSKEIINIVSMYKKELLEKEEIELKIQEEMPLTFNIMDNGNVVNDVLNNNAG